MIRFLLPASIPINPNVANELRIGSVPCLQLATPFHTQLQYAEQSSSPYQKQIVSLQLIAILWMCVEAAIVLFTAATSPWVDRRTNSEYDKLPPKACTVVVADLNETAHQLDVTAKTLYEAVAQALATVRGHDWVGDIGRGLTTVAEKVRNPEVTHIVKFKISKTG
jgi:hypothetical protein